MASKMQFFERDLKLATAGLEPGAINAALAAFAKKELQRVISSGQASTTYERYVNGRSGAAEETVKAPGPIVYQFVNWPLLIRDAISELKTRVPVKSGRYAGGFMVIANQAVVRNYAAIPVNAEVIIINVRPYTRKMESGANKTGKRHFEATKNALASRFRGVFDVDFRYLSVSGGLQNGVPYILKVGARARKAAQNNRSSAFRAGREALSVRKDRQAGMPITYPALIINAV
ncbi:hypothetical protein [Rhizobium sp.]|jgi:hypothetical protein|uniref:hypothetical protein n=1 Tax=Rhizobium sp. TaxID=391 RepID=UPI000E8AC4C9|nr:hypothetical protein [Rhizobium sp.]